MNVINVIGGTKNQRKLAEKIAWFCIKDMMPRYRTLDIEIPKLYERNSTIGLLLCFRNK